MSVGGFAASVTTCMDWAVNEFSVSGTPSLTVFDSNLTMTVDTSVALTTSGAGATLAVNVSPASSATSTGSMTQRVLVNTDATTETA